MGANTRAADSDNHRPLEAVLRLQVAPISHAHGRRVDATSMAAKATGTF